MELVSILVNNYNYGRYLRQCIDSMLGQTYPNVEVLVNDDCSTDGSQEILRSYGESIRTFYATKNSGGVFVGTNRMIEAARGEYILLYDADDWLEPNAIEECVRVFKQAPSITYVYTGARVHYASGREEVWPATDYASAKEIVRATWLKGGSGAVNTRGMVRVDIAQRYGYIEREGISIDQLTLFHWLKIGLRPKAINKPLRHYRIHAASDSRNIELRIKSFNVLLNYLIEEFPEVINELIPRGMTRQQYLWNYFRSVAASNMSRRINPMESGRTISAEDMLRYCKPLFDSARHYAQGG